MSDNSTIPATGDVYRSVDQAGVKWFTQVLASMVGATPTLTSSANPLPVLHTGALPAGANAIGKLAANAGVNIGTVDVATSVLPTGAATEASLAALLATLLVDNGTAFTDGTSKVLPGGHLFDEVAGTALTENDVAASRIDSKRAQVFVQEDETTRGQRQTVYASKAAKSAASIETGVLLVAGAELTPKFKFVNVAASQTNSTVVAAVTSKKIRVMQIAVLGAATATNVTFNSAGGPTAISPLMANGANGGEILPFSPMGWFETLAGEALSVTTSAGATTGILVGYIEV